MLIRSSKENMPFCSPFFDRPQGVYAVTLGLAHVLFDISWAVCFISDTGKVAGDAYMILFAVNAKAMKWLRTRLYSFILSQVRKNNKGSLKRSDVMRGS